MYDHFHLVKLLNDKLSELRRELQQSAADKATLKGTRWLLLKRPERLDPERREAERLDAALRLNKPLATAYYLKEDLGQVWNQTSKEDAAIILDDWIWAAEGTGIRQLVTFARTVRSLTGSLRGTMCRFPQDRWRARTTRSKPCTGSHTAFATPSTSSCGSTPCTRPTTRSSDNHGRKHLMTRSKDMCRNGVAPHGPGVGGEFPHRRTGPFPDSAAARVRRDWGDPRSPQATPGKECETW